MFALKYSLLVWCNLFTTKHSLFHCIKDSLPLHLIGQGLPNIASDWSNLSRNFIGFDTLFFESPCSFLKASKIEGVWNEFTVESGLVRNLDEGANKGDCRDLGTRCCCSCESGWVSVSFTCFISSGDVWWSLLLLVLQILIGFVAVLGLSRAFIWTFLMLVLSQITSDKVLCSMFNMYFWR